MDQNTLLWNKQAVMTTSHTHQKFHVDIIEPFLFLEAYKEWLLEKYNQDWFHGIQVIIHLRMFMSIENTHMLYQK